MARFRSPVLEFAEAMMAHKLEEGRDKFKNSWEVGIWMGRVTTTGEQIMGCPTGVLKVRSVKRRPESLQWDRGLFECMVWRPWAAQSVEAALQYRRVSGLLGRCCRATRTRATTKAQRGVQTAPVIVCIQPRECSDAAARCNGNHHK